MELTAARVRSVLSYDPDTGLFVRKSSSKVQWSGRAAGTVNRYGYVRIQVDGRVYPASHLAWLHAYGRWPVEIIDHINGDRADNRLANLREATNALNKANSRLRQDSASGLKGAYRDGSRWRAQIRVNGKTFHIGRFSTKEQAHEAYMSEARKHFGEFARAA